jgi:hypothetical protein
MYAADISKADALVLFLLPQNLEKLTPKFLDMRPGTRIVDNTFAIPGWAPDVTEKIESDGCSTWCTALLWIVPAKVKGTWRSPQGDLTLDQEFQMVTGTVMSPAGAVAIENGRLNGEQISFRAGGADYSGKVSGSTIEGTVKSGADERGWSATRQ